jgi:hypothetical protein
MQTKIKNPYEPPTEGNVPSGAMAAAFEQGVQAALAATKPRRFAEQQPEEQQEIILFGNGRGPVIQVFISWNVSEGTYNGYTHWLPYPELL